MVLAGEVVNWGWLAEAVAREADPRGVVPGLLTEVSEIALGEDFLCGFHPIGRF